MRRDGAVPSDLHSAVKLSVASQRCGGALGSTVMPAALAAIAMAIIANIARSGLDAMFCPIFAPARLAPGG